MLLIVLAGPPSLKLRQPREKFTSK
jgi:hypothetical protein